MALDIMPFYFCFYLFFIYLLLFFHSIFLFLFILFIIIFFAPEIFDFLQYFHTVFSYLACIRKGNFQLDQTTTLICFCLLPLCCSAQTVIYHDTRTI